ncbi:MAG: arsenate reductase (glutaredoxin) [Planctomycetes bacterium]|jgi:arsenate reductase|nr:arsenate reductase (glutaredoxin) [Planctomycetota bacterium]MDP6410693.1 arsenate reductase family protein [Planctomycetota bacterium]
MSDPAAIRLLHNPRCSKSRAALALLEESSASLEVRLYLENPLDAGELATLAGGLGAPIGEWVRRKQPEYAAAGLGPGSDDAVILAAMAAEPILMERPIAVRGERALIARPPERVLELLADEQAPPATSPVDAGGA